MKLVIIGNSFQRKAGFTLIELLVTITIIAILAAVGMVVYSSTQKSARISKRLQDMLAIRTAVETYKSSNPGYPLAPTANQCIGSSNGLGAASIAFTPTYMPVLPNDPSNGNSTSAPCYRYQSNGSVGPPVVYATEYKIWVTGNEMAAPEYKTQPQYIDPARDGVNPADCVIDPLNANVAGWAVYNGSTTGSCLY